MKRSRPVQALLVGCLFLGMLIACTVYVRALLATCSLGTSIGCTNADESSQVVAHWTAQYSTTGQPSYDTQTFRGEFYGGDPQVCPASKSTLISDSGRTKQYETRYLIPGTCQIRKGP